MSSNFECTSAQCRPQPTSACDNKEIALATPHSANDVHLNEIDFNNNDALVGTTHTQIPSRDGNYLDRELEATAGPSTGHYPVERKVSSPTENQNRDRAVDAEVESVVTSALGLASFINQMCSPNTKNLPRPDEPLDPEIEAALPAAFGLTPADLQASPPSQPQTRPIRERAQNSPVEAARVYPVFSRLTSAAQQDVAQTDLQTWPSDESETESDNDNETGPYSGFSSYTPHYTTIGNNEPEEQIPLVPISPPLNLLEELGITADQAVLIALAQGPPPGYVTPRGYTFPGQRVRRVPPPLPFGPHIGEPPHELFADTDEESEEEDPDDVVAPEAQGIRGIHGFVVHWFWRFVILMLSYIFPQGAAENIADLLRFEIPSIREGFFMLMAAIWNLIVWLFRSDPTRPMTVSELDLLEPHHVTEEERQAEETCAICFDGFDEGQDCVELPCGHVFHRSCLNQWLLLRGDCPMCRGTARSLAHRFHFVLQYIEFPPTFVEMWDLTQEIDNEDNLDATLLWYEDTFTFNFLFNFFRRQEEDEDPPIIINFQIPLSQLEAVESAQEI